MTDSRATKAQSAGQVRTVRIMATLTESTAVFEAKLKDLGLEAYKDEMGRRGGRLSPPLPSRAAGHRGQATMPHSSRKW